MAHRPVGGEAALTQPPHPRSADCGHRMDKPKAVAAAAHKLARLIYTMLTRGEEYTDQGQAYCEERYRDRVLRQLSQRANKLGMQLVAAPQAA